MPRREHQQTKRLIQQRQERQRARPTSTAKTSGGGIGGQQRQGMTVQFQPDPELNPNPTPAEILRGGWRAVKGESLSDPTASQRLCNDPARPAFLTPAPVAPAPSLPEVRARLDAQLAPLPRRGEALTPQLDALYRASRALADHIAEFDTITDGAYLHDLESALDGITTPETEAPFTPAQTTALDLTRQLASDLAIHAHHSHLDELIRRIPELGTACGRAVANALREAR